MTQFMMRWTTFSFLLVGCGTLPRPDVDLMVVNAPGNKRCGYNMLRDYDADGHLKPGVKMFCRPNASIKDLNKSTVLDSEAGFPDALARMKAYIKIMREEFEKRCQ